MAKTKYYILDTLLEEGYIVGDIKILASLTRRNPRIIRSQFNDTNYMVAGKNDRYVIVKNPRYLKRYDWKEFLEKIRERDD